VAANGITDAEANAILDARIETNSEVDLVTVMGTATAAPTKVTGGSYVKQTPAWAAASAREKHNSGTVTFAGLPTATIVGTDLAHASAGARSWFVPFTASKSVTAGDSIVFAAGGLSYSFVNGT
jgi:hypothetical protein